MQMFTVINLNYSNKKLIELMFIYKYVYLFKSYYMTKKEQN